MTQIIQGLVVSLVDVCESNMKGLRLCGLHTFNHGFD